LEKYPQFYTETERKEIVESIVKAESKTSGEIRIHLEDHCDHLPEDRAAFIFEKLHMHETEQRNGVLFYISVCDHDFAVIGDKGIHAAVGSEYWRELCVQLEQDFRAGSYKDGLIRAILRVGESLSEFFPRRADDKNELENEISMGEL
jgi:uncharacterized membrane protein